MVDEAMRVRVIRAITGMTKGKMGQVFGVGPNTIGNWESGRHVPNLSSRKILAEICQKNKISIRPDGFPVPVESSDGA